MRVEVHLYSQSQPSVFENVRNAYTKDSLYCVWTTARADGTPEEAVYKFPTEHIFRIKEVGPTVGSYGSVTPFGTAKQ